jgi:hypothetical protein
MTRISALLKWLHKIWRPSYEPSRHYMRGPGPAATAKRHQQATGDRDADNSDA